MAYDKAPGSWIDDWTEDGADIAIATAFGAGNSFPEMTAAEADAVSGDMANVWYAMCHEMFEKWNAQAVADRPSNWTLSKGSSTNVATGKTTVTFTAQFVTSVAVGEQNVDAEA